MDNQQPTLKSLLQSFRPVRQLDLIRSLVCALLVVGGVYSQLTAPLFAADEVAPHNATIPPTKDLLPGDPALASSNPLHFVTIGNVTYFVATNTAAGSELWQSDGTAAGTLLVRDIYPGAASSAPAQLTNVNGRLFFTANDGSTGRELWSSDGTEGGTQLVKDIFAGTVTQLDQARTPPEQSGDPTLLTAVNQRLYFVVKTSAGLELWQSDGTPAGTQSIKTLAADDQTTVSEMVAVGDALLLVSNSVRGAELWQIDAAGNGAPIAQSQQPKGLRDLTTLDGTTLYYARYDGENTGLWRFVVGTTAPQQVTVLYPFPNSENFTFMPQLTPLGNGVLLFRAYAEATGVELWQSQGASATLVKDLNPGPDSSFFTPLTAQGAQDVLYFTAFENSTGVELWRSNGTAGGTQLVKDLNPGLPDAFTGPTAAVTVGTTLFFQLDDGVHGRELWHSDGTAAGTELVKDIQPGSAASWSFYGIGATLVALNDRLLFGADDGVNGLELWQSDGSAANTHLLKDIALPGNAMLPPFPDTQPTLYAEPENLTALRSRNVLFFTTFDTQQGTRLWASGAGLKEPLPLRTIDGAQTESFAGFMSLTAANETVFFAAPDPSVGVELWKSDGTAGGTTFVKDIYTGTQIMNGVVTANDSTPTNLTNVNGRLFFVATDQGLTINGVAKPSVSLWVSDGTPDGTAPVQELISGTAQANISWLTNVNGTLFFSADDGKAGKELWQSDGTVVGTRRLFDLYPGTARGTANSSAPSHLTNAGFSATGSAQLYFIARDAQRLALWVSDGTISGTVALADMEHLALLLQDRPDYPILPTQQGLFFLNYDEAHGYELWKSDGTPAGTGLVKDIYPGPDGSFPGHLTRFKNKIIFSANNGSDGYELWQSDGTISGTVQIKDIHRGPTGSLPQGFTLLPDGRLVFAAADHTFGMEIWQTDGTPSGTRLLLDLALGYANSNPADFLVMGNQLYFVADNGITGRELWSLPVDGLQPPTFLDLYLPQVQR